MDSFGWNICKYKHIATKKCVIFRWRIYAHVCKPLGQTHFTIYQEATTCYGMIAENLYEIITEYALVLKKEGINYISYNHIIVRLYMKFS